MLSCIYAMGYPRAIKFIYNMQQSYWIRNLFQIDFCVKKYHVDILKEATRHLRTYHSGTYSIYCMCGIFIIYLRRFTIETIIALVYTNLIIIG